MVRTGYAALVKSLALLNKPPPTTAHSRERFVTLCRFVARGVLTENSKVAHQHYAHKDYAAALGIKLHDDVLTVQHLHDFVRDTAKVEPLTKLQLQLMVLETRIYLLTRFTFKLGVRTKFQDPAQILSYHEWASFTQGPAATPETYPPMLAEYDSAPDVTVVMPELPANAQCPLSQAERRHYPPLLTEWWSRGYVRAMLIDSLGTRRRCDVWQVPRHLGNRAYEARVVQVVAWAIEAEILKVEISLGWIQASVQKFLDAWSDLDNETPPERRQVSSPPARSPRKKMKRKNHLWLP